MENENSKKKTTAPDTSVGADDGQPLHNSTENSISAFEGEINGDFQNSTESLDEIYRRMQRLTDPHYLHTISMTELYQTAYQSRPPIIDGLLYAGAYILAGAPKIGKSFLVAQIAYHVSTGKALWDYEVHPGTVLYLALEDDFQRIQSRMFMMYGVNDTDRLHFATAAGKIGNGLDEQLRTSCGNIPTPDSLSLTPCRKYAKSAARRTATPAIMRSSVGSSNLPTSTASAF